VIGYNKYIVLRTQGSYKFADTKETAEFWGFLPFSYCCQAIRDNVIIHEARYEIFCRSLNDFVAIVKIWNALGEIKTKYSTIQWRYTIC